MLVADPAKWSKCGIAWSWGAVLKRLRCARKGGTRRWSSAAYASFTFVLDTTGGQSTGEERGGEERRGEERQGQKPSKHNNKAKSKVLDYPEHEEDACKRVLCAAMAEGV